MQTKIKYFGFFTVLSLFLASCSSVKITDTWTDTDVVNFKNQKILVVSVSDTDTSRMRFENDMVQDLNENGYQSEVSYVDFPEISPSKKVKGEALENLKDKLRKDGVSFVLVNIVRDVQNYTTSTTSGSSYNTMPYYGRYYHRGFYGYYGGMSTGTASTVTQEKTKYILESIVYDLSKPEDKQLQAIITSEIDNPDTVGTASKEFSEKIIKELNKIGEQK
jgi:hypothetical protein